MQEKLNSVDKERMFWLDKVELLETEYENQFKEVREAHQKEVHELKSQSESQILELEQQHRKDKVFL